MADVSVIIPCYNAGAYLAETLDSVLAQTDVPREILAVNNRSTDNTVEIIERYQAKTDGRVRLLSEPTPGVSRTRNRAIEASTMPYIAFLDSDDLWLPAKTEKQLELIESDAAASGVHSHVFHFHRTFNDLNHESAGKVKDRPTAPELMEYHWIITSAAMVRRDALGDIRFPEDSGDAEDLVVFADVALRGDWRLLDEPLVAKRKHPGQVTEQSLHAFRSLQTRVRWYRAHADVLGAEVVDHLEQEMQSRAIGALEGRYWRRQFRQWDEAIAIVRELFPEAIARSAIAQRRIWPRWVYGIVDRLTGHGVGKG